VLNSVCFADVHLVSVCAFIVTGFPSEHIHSNKILAATPIAMSCGLVLAVMCVVALRITNIKQIRNFNANEQDFLTLL